MAAGFLDYASCFKIGYTFMCAPLEMTDGKRGCASLEMTKGGSGYAQLERTKGKKGVPVLRIIPRCACALLMFDKGGDSLF